MASASEIAILRQLTNEPDSSTYTDEQLSAMIDSDGIDSSASEIWTRKAASLSSAVDMSEGGSSRKNSDLLKNALTMAQMFKARAEEAISSSGRVSTGISRLRRR